MEPRRNKNPAEWYIWQVSQYIPHTLTTDHHCPEVSLDRTSPPHWLLLSQEHLVIPYHPFVVRVITYNAYIFNEFFTTDQFNQVGWQLNKFRFHSFHYIYTFFPILAIGSMLLNKLIQISNGISGSFKFTMFFFKRIKPLKRPSQCSLLSTWGVNLGLNATIKRLLKKVHWGDFARHSAI